MGVSHPPTLTNESGPAPYSIQTSKSDKTYYPHTPSRSRGQYGNDHTPRHILTRVGEEVEGIGVKVHIMGKMKDHNS